MQAQYRVAIFTHARSAGVNAADRFAEFSQVIRVRVGHPRLYIYTCDLAGAARFTGAKCAPRHAKRSLLRESACSVKREENDSKTISRARAAAMREADR